MVDLIRNEVDMVRSKTCFKCGKTLPSSEFYKHPGMGDGYLGKCKECAKKDSTERRNKKIDEVRAYDRDRAKTAKRRKHASEMGNRWRLEDNRRSSSHNAIARAIKKGTITRSPCCICGSDKSVAHHESYDKPLEVVFYCQIHHKERHKQMAISGIEP
jgi:hypothetical protein